MLQEAEGASPYFRVGVIAALTAKSASTGRRAAFGYAFRSETPLEGADQSFAASHDGFHVYEIGAAVKKNSFQPATQQAERLMLRRP
jgi:hypothetical protein